MANSSLSEKQAAVINAALTEFFKTHPAQDKAHVTIDGTVFFSKDLNAAINHAKTLKNAEVVTVSKGSEVPGSDEQVAKEAAEKAAAEQAAVEAKEAAEKAAAEQAEAEAKEAAEKAAAEQAESQAKEAAEKAAEKAAKKAAAKK